MPFVFATTIWHFAALDIAFDEGIGSDNCDSRPFVWSATAEMALDCVAKLWQLTMCI